MKSILIRLTTDDINNINNALNASHTITLTPNQFLTELENEGISAPIFNGLTLFLSYIETVYFQTNFDETDHMRLGIGLDLNDPTSADLITAMNKQFPNLNPVIIKDIRRALVSVFPYGVIYSIENEAIEIYAIAHLHRRPFYWKKRK